MKNFPDVFPIRYAILALNPLEDDFENQRDNEILFKQLMIYLQKKSVNKNDLTLYFSKIGFQQLGCDVASIIKLGKSVEDTEDLNTKVRNFSTDITSSNAYGIAFNLVLISYRGNYEVPIFSQIYNNRDNNEILKQKFGYSANRKEIEYFHNLYCQLMKREINEWDFWRIRSSEQEAISIVGLYSQLWKELDDINNKAMNGIIPELNINKMLTISKMNDKENDSSNHKINIVVCKNWRSLFLEEIYRLYKMANFCNNCGKALPFKFKGKYCPDTKENISCKRERSRKRKRSQKK